MLNIATANMDAGALGRFDPVTSTATDNYDQNGSKQQFEHAS